MTGNDRNQHIPIEDLSTYADGEIWETTERERIEQHLAVCDFCSQELAELRAISSLLADLPEPELPRSFHLSPDDVAGSRSPSLAQDPIPIQPWIMRHQTLFRYAGLAAALLLVVVVTIDLLPETTNDIDDVTTMMDEPVQESAPEMDEEAEEPSIMTTDDSADLDEPDSVDDPAAIEDRDMDEPAVEEDAVEDSAADAQLDDEQADQPLSEEADVDDVQPFAETERDAADGAQPMLMETEADDGLSALQIAAIGLALLSASLLIVGFVLPRLWKSSAR